MNQNVEESQEEKTVPLVAAFREMVSFWDIIDCYAVLRDYIDVEDVREFICEKLSDSQKYDIYTDTMNQ